MIRILLGIGRLRADTVINHYDGTRVWLKDVFFTNGKRIGVAVCCREAEPCGWHQALSRSGNLEAQGGTTGIVH